MTQVFISYSREDTGFVQRLHQALEARGHETWVDWEGIPPSDKWMKRILAAIDASEAFVFVISPDSIASEVCAQELAYAIEHHKRLIPILHREPQIKIPPALAEINYVFARDTDPFDTAVDTLVQAIDTDLDWVRAHTRLLVRAVEWGNTGREPSFTLRGQDLTDYEEWATQAPDKEPRPTVLQSEYLLASRRAVTRRQRITWTSIAGGLCIAIALGTVAWFQNQESNRQEAIVSARQLLSTAEGLRDAPDEDPGAHSQHANSLRAAVRALAAFDRLDVPTLDADSTLRKSYARIAKWRDIDTGNSSQEAAAIDPGGRYAGLYSGRRHVLVWDTTTGKRTGHCEYELRTALSARTLSISADGQRVAAYLYSSSHADSASPIIVWSMADCSQLLKVMVHRGNSADGLRTMALTPDGMYLIVLSFEGLEVWDVGDKTARRIPSDARIDLVAAGPNNRRMATYEYRREDRARLVLVRALPTGEVLQTLQVQRHPRGIFNWSGDALLTGTQRILFDQGVAVLPEDPEIMGERPVLSHDGRRVALRVKTTSEHTGGQRTPIEIRDAATGILVARSFRSDNIKTYAFTADDHGLITIDPAARRISTWKIDPPNSYARLQTATPMNWIGFSADDGYLIAKSATTVQSWKLPGIGSAGMPIPEDRPESPLPPIQTASGEFLAEAHGATGLRAVIVKGRSTRGGVRRTLQIWRGETKLTGLELQPVLDGNVARYLHFAGAGRYVVIDSRRGLEVREAETLNLVATLFHRDVIRAGLDTTGRHAVTMAADLSVRVWDIATGLEMIRLTTDTRALALALSNDGRWLAAIDTNRRISLWALAPPDLIAQACGWLDGDCP
jgi:WD40 repeat protein